MLRTIPRQRSLIEPEIQNPFVHKLHLGFLDIVKVSVSTSVFTIVLNIRTNTNSDTFVLVVLIVKLLMVTILHFQQFCLQTNVLHFLFAL